MSTLNPFQKGKKFYSIVACKCPRCHQGDLFIHSHFLKWKGGLDMHDHCVVCQQDFKIEPGFYIGALWASFPVVIILMALLSGLFLGIMNLTLVPFFICLGATMLFLQPILVRWGRSIWINIFVHYDPNQKE
jgi:uncharacterized protein (DUF983 family)